ncbi:hypothetical protein ACFV6D_12715 [Kitasatospora sp. NPDC059812]|uniref:hypothetical protein n=1 Tax=unclassified Kitasatospora TaxID=2633591 RepID=UPI0034492182
MTRRGFSVTVQGDLEGDVLQRIGDTVRRLVLDQVAELDLAPPLREVPLGGAGSAGDAVDALLKRPGPIGLQMEQE